MPPVANVLLVKLRSDGRNAFRLALTRVLAHGTHTQ